MPRLYPERRRAQLLDKIDSAAFWTFIGAAIGLVWMAAGGWPVL